MNGIKIYTPGLSKRVCDICGSLNHAPLGKITADLPNRKGLYRFTNSIAYCRQCGFMFCDMVPNESFLKDYYYNAFTNDVVDAGKEPDSRYDHRIELIKDNVPPGSRILEIGGSTGSLMRHFPGSTSIDYLQPGVIPEGYYDALVSFNTFEHAAHPKRLLNSCLPYLNEGAKIIIEVPDLFKNPTASFGAEHFSYFTPEHLRLFLSSTGFVDIKPLEPTRPYNASMIGTLAHKRPDEQKYQGIYSNFIKGVEIKGAYYKSIAGNVAATADAKVVTVLHFWPANYIATAVIEHLPERFNPVGIDESGSRIGCHYPGFDEPVKPCEQVRCEDVKVLIICSRFKEWNDGIAIKAKRIFPDASLIILEDDY